MLINGLIINKIIFNLIIIVIITSTQLSLLRDYMRNIIEFHLI